MDVHEANFLALEPEKWCSQIIPNNTHSIWLQMGTDEALCSAAGQNCINSLITGSRERSRHNMSESCTSLLFFFFKFWFVLAEIRTREPLCPRRRMWPFVHVFPPEPAAADWRVNHTESETGDWKSCGVCGGRNEDMGTLTVTTSSLQNSEVGLFCPGAKLQVLKTQRTQARLHCLDVKQPVGRLDDWLMAAKPVVTLKYKL